MQSQTIQIGKQVQVWRDDQPEIIVAIVHQHTRYGLVHVKKLAGRAEFVGLTYDHKVIPVEAVLEGLAQNAQRLQATAAAERKAMAASTGSMIQATLRQGQARPARRLSLSVREEVPRVEDKPGVDETISVQFEGIEPDPAGGW